MGLLDSIIPGAGLATGILSGITGLFQKSKANKLAKANVRPVYDTPAAVKANQAIAKTLSNEGMPGAQYAAQQQAIARGASNAIGQAQGRRSGLAAIGAIQQGSNDANLNLNVADSQQRIANIRNLISQNNVLAQYQDKAWDWNSKDKYQENAAAVRALNGAGNANINKGLDSIIGAGANLAADQYGGGYGGSYGTDQQQNGMPPSMQNYFRQRAFSQYGGQGYPG